MILAAVGLLWGCGSSQPPREALTVFAASSLTEAFEAIEVAYEQAHPDVDVRLVFAGSQVLRLQIAQGARADVFASADEDHMAALERAGRVEGVVPFARNEPVVIVPLASELRSFEDLRLAERIVLGTQTVPIGRYADAVLARTGSVLGAGFEEQVRGHVVSRESNVRLVRAKVELGEADAAIVYRTDVNEQVRALAVPPALTVAATYPIATVADGSDRAPDFVAFVTSAEGARLLEARGFTPVPR